MTATVHLRWHNQKLNLSVRKLMILKSHRDQLPSLIETIANQNMGKYVLKVTGELSNVTALEPVDTAESPFEYTFVIECTNCREEHDRPVTINLFEKHELQKSRGDALFIYKCASCGHEKSTTIVRTKESLAESGKWATILEIDSRGMELKKFIPDGRFQCTGADSGTRFDDVDLEDSEWYDYDDKAGEEVSITEVQWELARQ